VLRHGGHEPRELKKFPQNIPSIAFTLKEHFTQFPSHFHQQWGSFETPRPVESERKNDANMQWFEHVVRPKKCTR
jgi:hypothetical protein